jgi:hypothetical protein
MFEEGQEVYVKATIARANDKEAFVGFENVKGNGVHLGPYSFIVALTELVPTKESSAPNLEAEARRRYFNDPVFHARVKQAIMATEAVGEGRPSREASEFATTAVGIALLLGGV